MSGHLSLATEILSTQCPQPGLRRPADASLTPKRPLRRLRGSITMQLIVSQYVAMNMRNTLWFNGIKVNQDESN